MGFDWKYRVVCKSDMVLSPVAQQLYESFAGHPSPPPDFIPPGLEQNDTHLSDDAYAHFVKTGLLPAPKH